MVQPPKNTSERAHSDVHVSIDVASVGALWTRDPDLTWEALNQLDGLLETMVDDMGGRLIETEGEAFIIQFPDVARAVMWCARMQEGLLALDWPATLSANFDASGAADMLFGGLLARMAIHAGDIQALHALVTLTQPGQVLMTGQTWDTVTAAVPPDLQVTAIGKSEVEGQSMDVVQVNTRLLSRRRFGPLGKKSSALPRSNGCFIDRPEAMSDLRERIESGSRLVNLTGTNGVGKTRLARQWAQWFESTGQGEVALIPLENALDHTDLHLATAAALGLSLSNEMGGSLDERVGHAIASRGPLVLILDDFPAGLDSTALATWLHAAPQTRLLLTSSEPLSSSQSTHLQLEPMKQDDASALYLARTHRRLRGHDRPTHASAIELPEPLTGMSPRDIENTTGFPQHHRARPKLPTLMHRHIVINDELSSQERIDAALECVPVLNKMGMSDIALSLLDRVRPLVETSDDPEKDLIWRGSLADALISSGQLEKAQDLLENNESSSVEWLLRRGEIALANDHYDDAVEILAAAPPGNSEVAYALGQALAGSGDWEESVPHLELACKTLTDSSKRGHAWAALGRVLSDLGQGERSNQALEHAVNLKPDDPHLIAKVHLHRFEGASASLDLETAQMHLNAATSTLLQCGDRCGAAQSLTHAGVLSLIRHEPESAKAVLHRARSISREDGLQIPEAKALLAIGIAGRMQGDLGTALDAFAEASALADHDPCLAALIHAHRGATEAACDAIDNATEAFEKSEELLESGWDPIANTIHDVLMGFVDLARAREAALDERKPDVESHVDLALNRLARASSFETRSTPPRGREVPSRINELRLARLLLDYALGSLPNQGI